MARNKTPGLIPYEVWPADNDDTQAQMRVIQGIEPGWVAEEYVEHHHGELDYPTAIRVRVRRVNDPEVLTFDVEVHAVPEAHATPVEEQGAGRG